MDRIDRILSEPQKQKCLVVGMSSHSLQAALTLKQFGCEVIFTAPACSDEFNQQLHDHQIKVALGADRTDLLEKTNLVVLSPEARIRPLAHPFPARAIRLGLPIVGELELAVRILKKGSPSQKFLAITGTSGKSSTAAICAHLLAQAGKSVFEGGDANRPLSDLVIRNESLDWVVLSVSAFQLEHLSAPKAFVPDIGIWLNLTPHNLDRHITMRNYGRKKRSLFEGMTPAQVGVFFLDDSNVNQFHEGLDCTIHGASRNPARVPLHGVLLIRDEITPNGWDTPLLIRNPRLAGDHNAENAACAVTAMLAAGLDRELIQSGLDSYAGLPKRLEVVREIQGVQYVDDSLAHTPEATAKALTAFRTPVILICGGVSKADFSQLSHMVSKKVRQVIVIEGPADLIQALEPAAPVIETPTMTEALHMASELAQPDEVILYSPACAQPARLLDKSEHRFSELVQAL